MPRARIGLETLYLACDVRKTISKPLPVRAPACIVLKSLSPLRAVTSKKLSALNLAFPLARNAVKLKVSLKSNVGFCQVLARSK